MRNNKGFTLVELVIVVGLLGLFGVSIGMSLNSLLKGTKDNEYENYVSRIESSANLFISENSELLEELYTDKGYIIITTQDLIEEGLLDENIINPETNEPVDYDDIIKISLTSTGTIDVEYQALETTEDYLQVMDIISEIKKSNANDLCYQGINSSSLRYVEANGTISSTYLVKDQTIKCDGSNVNVNKLGTYELKYDYLDNKTKKWKQQSRNVTIVDTVAPSIVSLTESDGIITATAKDEGSGIKYYLFSTDGSITDLSHAGRELTSNPETITETYTVSSSGLRFFYVQDEAGNINKQSIQVSISEEIIVIENPNNPTDPTDPPEEDHLITVFTCVNEDNKTNYSYPLNKAWTSIYFPSAGSNYNIKYGDDVVLGRGTKIIVHSTVYRLDALTYNGICAGYDMYLIDQIDYGNAYHIGGSAISISNSRPVYYIKKACVSENINDYCHAKCTTPCTGN